MNGKTLQEYYDSLKAMVKAKTGRAMQEKDVEYTDKNGRTHVRKGSSPLREGVAIIMENTTMGDLKRFTNAVEKRWGIRAVQIHIHRDEGHYEDSERKKTWKPNYHAHIVWDWMDHDTGKSHKLGEADMSEMQDMLAEMLNMQRGQKKSETGLDHLERNDFILQKQEKEKKRLEEEKRKIQSERDVAKNQARQATEEKNKAEKNAQEAQSELSRLESKTTEKQIEIDKLDQRITAKLAKFNDWELNRAEREVKDVADGRYDWRFPRIENGRGLSR
ncbi:MAG: hypothetical protein IJK05_08915 [Bacteroidales bacterium]|nr:hypothetical protein [Bacteroidales bacterium]